VGVFRTTRLGLAVLQSAVGSEHRGLATVVAGSVVWILWSGVRRCAAGRFKVRCKEQNSETNYRVWQTPNGEGSDLNCCMCDLRLQHKMQGNITVSPDTLYVDVSGTLLECRRNRRCRNSGGRVWTRANAQVRNGNDRS
jgi:hypothetical protein